MGAFDQLEQGMRIFNQGISRLTLQRSLSKANKAIEEINASEDLEDKERRTALQNVARNLSLQLAKTGVGAATIKTLTEQFQSQPRQRLNSIQQALIDSDPANRALGRQALVTKNMIEKSIANSFKEDPSKKPLTPAQKFKREKFRRTQFNKLADKIDPSAEVRSAFGKLAQNINRINAAEAILAGVQDRGTLSPVETKELALSVAEVLTQGQAVTDERLKELSANALNLKVAEAEQFLESGVRPANIPEFIDLYAKLLRRERNVAEARIEEFIRKRTKGFIGLANDSPQQFKNVVASAMQEAGVTPDDIIITKNDIKYRGTIERAKKLKVAARALLEARRLIRSGDKNNKDKALEILKALKMVPADVKESNTRALIRALRFRIDAGFL